MTGRERRLARIFGRDGRTVVVAFDHAAYYEAPDDGLARPTELVETIVRAGADAVLLSFGTARASLEVLGRVGLILAVEPHDVLAVETAVTLGADAVKTITFPWQAGVPDDRAQLASLGARAWRWGMPYLIETIPGGFDADREMRSPRRLAAAARIAAELGADFVKTFATEDPAGVKVIVDYCSVPVLVLGGRRDSSTLAFLRMVADSLEAGAAGVVAGRNVWGQADPAVITAAIAAVVHGGASPRGAQREARRIYAPGVAGTRRTQKGAKTS